MKVIIIDDEQTSIEALEKQLKNYDDVVIAATATSGLKGISAVREIKPDLLFLDVELPDMSGLEFLGQISQICKEQTRVVIYTAHSSYMLPAFRGKAFDFLQKPIDPEEIKKILQRYHMETGSSPSSNAKQKDSEKVILYTNATDFRVVDMRDVGLFQYNHEQRVWEVVVAGKQEPMRLKRSVNNETLTEIDPRFVQVSQRYIININYLMEVSDSLCLLYPPFDGIKYVKVGRQFRKKLIEQFSTL